MFLFYLDFSKKIKTAKSKDLGRISPVNQYRDCRNIYVAVNQEGDDIDKAYFREDFTLPDLYQGIDEDAPNYHIISFGNCYLNSYSTEWRSWRISCSRFVSYTSYNVNFDMSGSGFIALDIETKSGKLNGSNEVVIPRVLARGRLFRT